MKVVYDVGLYYEDIIDVMLLYVGMGRCIFEGVGFKFGKKKICVWGCNVCIYSFIMCLEEEIVIEVENVFGKNYFDEIVKSFVCMWVWIGCEY